MPILTTTYPLMNSTFNVSQHTQKLIQEKMLVAAEICDRVLDEKEQWEALFKVCKIIYRIIAKTKRTRVLSEEKCQKDTTRLSKSRV